MEILVQKFGGTSVSEEGLPRLLNIVKKQTRPLVVVVSAEKGVTNALLQQAQKENLSPQETDALLVTGEEASVKKIAHALHAIGKRTESFFNKTIVVKTDNYNQEAKIISIDPAPILEALASNSIAIVAGFQGMNLNDEPTTLGRGGSDLTALAVASALRAKCEIYTDVCGVYTANPRHVPHATQFSTLNWSILEEMARLGSQVMQLRSVSFAKRARLPFTVRSTWEENCEGTTVTDQAPMEAAITIDTQSSLVQIPKNKFIKKLQQDHFAHYNSLQIDFVKSTDETLSCTLPTPHLDRLQMLMDINDIQPIGRVSYVAPMTQKLASCISQSVAPYPILAEVIGSMRHTLLVPLEITAWLANHLHALFIEKNTSPVSTQEACVEPLARRL